MSDPNKMYGPYANRDDAAKAGFKKVKGNPRRDNFEFAFWVVMKPNPGKKPSFCFTEPQTSDEHNMVRIKAPPGLNPDYVHAFCHTHPTDSGTSGVFFGYDDKLHFRESRKYFHIIAWYLLNSNGDILVANDETQFLGGRPIKW